MTLVFWIRKIRFTCDGIPNEEPQNSQERLDRVSGGVEHGEESAHDGHHEAQADEGDGRSPQAHVDELLVDRKPWHSFKIKNH